MKRWTLLLISLFMGLMGANAQSNKYDLNADGDVNITDVTMLVNSILQQNEDDGYDLNADSDVNITDVILLVNYILEGHDNLLCPDNHHPHMIDLGLPSGTLWSCCNVGADKPEAYGGYYAWGETVEKDYYHSNTYQYYQNGSFADIGKEIADTQNDVAHVLWRDAWQMPKSEQIKELKDNCAYEWTTINGINGLRFTGTNGKSIFLPAAGSR